MKRYLETIMLFSFLYAHSSLVANEFVHFNQAMKPSKKYTPSLIQTNPSWQTINKLYEKHIIEPNQRQKNIPDIFHHIWVSKPLPKKSEPLRMSWIEHHPNWKFIFWTDDEANFKFGTIVVNNFEELSEALKSDVQFIVVDVRKASFINQEALNAAKNPGERSDIIRYEALYAVGGIYVDTDFECLKSFEEINQLCDFYAGISFSDRVCLLNSLIGSAPKCPVLKYCIKNLRKANGPTSTPDILKRTGQWLLTGAFFQAMKEQTQMRAVILPSTYFYPLPHWCRKDKKEKIENWIQPESLAIHHWHTTWFQ